MEEVAEGDQMTHQLQALRLGEGLRLAVRGDAHQPLVHLLELVRPPHRDGRLDLPRLPGHADLPQHMHAVWHATEDGRAPMAQLLIPHVALFVQPR